MSSQSGAVAVVFGLVGSHQISAGGAIKQQDGTPVGGAVSLSKFNDGAGFSLEFSSDLVIDEDGVPRVALNYTTLWNAEFEFTPKASSKANAEAELFIAVPGATITPSNLKCAAFNVAWRITGMSIRCVKAGVTTYTIRAQRSPEADITTPVS